MNNTQLYIGLGIPCLAIITSLIVSILQVSGIREDMRHMRTEFHGDYQALRRDMQDLTGKAVDIDNRLTRIEERLEHR
jgi:hypothetical protein